MTRCGTPLYLLFHVNDRLMNFGFLRQLFLRDITHREFYFSQAIGQALHTRGAFSSKQRILDDCNLNVLCLLSFANRTLKRAIRLNLKVSSLLKFVYL